MALEYDTITDFQYNPFTDTCTNVPIGYAGADCEVRVIPDSPYILWTYHAPVENVPSYFDIYIGATQLTEVAKTQCPANNQYRVNYDEKGCGAIEFHSNQCGCTACLCYCHVGTLLGKDALDVRLNVYCGVNCALCAYASNSCAIYTCADNNIGGYFYAACCYGVIGVSACDRGVFGCSNYNGIFGCAITGNGVYGIAPNYGGKFCATTNYGVCADAVCYGGKFKSTSCYGVCGEAGCFGGAFCALEYGICARGLCGIAGYFCTDCNDAICAIAGCCFAIYACAAACTIIACSLSTGAIYAIADAFTGICATAGCDYGVAGVAIRCYGVHGTASCYGVCGLITTSRPVSGNGAYYDSTSNRNIKMNKQNISILECFDQHPDFSVQKWQYADINQTGFDYFIGPYAEDIKCVFDLTFDDTGIYDYAGIALGATIELYKKYKILEEKIKLLGAKIGN